MPSPRKPLPLHLTVTPTPGGVYAVRCALCGPVEPRRVAGGCYWRQADARRAAQSHARTKRHREDAAALALDVVRAYRARA
jgi:hypothetical protein